MTCIVALKHNGDVWMGADSAGVAGLSIQSRADPKIYRVGPMLLGFTSSFRMGQLLGYSLNVPDHDPRVPVAKYMSTQFIDAVRACLKAGGFARKDNDVEQGGTFLVAYRHDIFYIDGDYQVGMLHDPYAAVGCGADIALGSLCTSHDTKTIPRNRVYDALIAAARHSAGVRAPFVIEKLEPTTPTKEPS